MKKGRAATAGFVATLALVLACGEPDAPRPAPSDEPEVETPREPDAEPAPVVPDDAIDPTPVVPEVAPGEPAPEPPPGPVPAPAPQPAPPPESTPPPDPEPAPDAASAISLGELADRIKETRAIGVFTKLALKNDIDDLLAELAAYHDRGVGELGALQRRYEALVLKLLTLLESDEPDLAVALARSREEIWSRLADPVRFAEIDT